MNGIVGENEVDLPCEAVEGVFTLRGAMDGLSPEEGSLEELFTKGFFDEITFLEPEVLICPPVFDFLRLNELRPV